MLSAMALDDTGAAADEARSIIGTEQAFFADAHKLVFDAICTLRESDQAVDIITIARYLESHNKYRQVGSERLHDILYATPSIGHVGDHARIVRDLYRLRRTMQEAGRVDATARALADADHEQIQNFLNDNEMRFSDVAHVGMPSALQPISDVLHETWKAINAAHQQGSAVTGVPTGFERLDSITTGLHDGDLIIVAGRPSQGKTALALAAARRIAGAGFAVPIFSLEMPADQLARRLLASEARVDLKRINNGRIQPNEWTKLTAAMETLSALPLFVDDTAGPTVLDIRAVVGKLQREIQNGKHASCTKGRIGAVVVDYLQMVRATTPGRSREQEVSDTSRTLKGQAKTFSAPYIVVSPLNREPEKRPNARPRLADLRESGAIEYDADVVLFVHRPELYEKDDPQLKGWAEIIVGKQRNGPTGSIKLAYRGEYTLFDNLADYEGGYDEASEQEYADLPEWGDEFTDGGRGGF